MPTRDRRGFVGRAIRYFARQDYVDRELVILDDGDDPVSDVADRRQRIRYVRLEARLSIGAKRNLGCELARGDVVVHWDDDDWYAPNRISYQVEQLKQHGASVCGPRRLLYYEPMRGRAWLYEYPADEQDPWVAGSALCYRIEAWLRAPFPDVDRGEDTSFVRNHILDAPLVLEDHRFVVALLHGANTSSRIGAEPHWRPRPVGEIRRILGSDYETYGLTGLGQELR
jgi:glycosyltransferase involved in cell wall biosynthesis